MKYSFFAGKKISFAGNLINKILHEKLFKLFYRHFRGTEIVEIGVGQGNLLSHMQNVLIKYTGYEPCIDLYINLCKKYCRSNSGAFGISMRNNAIPPLLEADNSQDAVIMLHVLEHMREPSIVLQECHRVLRQNGILFLAVPSFLDWKEEFYNVDYTHVYPFTENRLRQILPDNGFEIEYMGYTYGCIMSDFGRIFNFVCKAMSKFLQIILPRKLGRSTKIIKLGHLFRENIIVVARKV